MEGHASQGHENHALTSPMPGDGGPRAGPGASAGGGGTVPGATAPQSPNSYCVPKSGGNRRSTATPPRQEPPVAGGRVGVDGAACEKHGGPCVAGGAAEDRRTPSGRDADRPAGYGGHSGPDLAAWTSDPPRRRGHSSRPAVPGPLTATVSLGDRLPARRRGLPGGLPERCWEVGARGGPAQAPWRDSHLASPPPAFPLHSPSAGNGPALCG